MKKHVFPIILILATIAIWIGFYTKLPSEIPIHWNYSGEIDGYATKLNAMLMNIGLMILLYALLVIAPKIDPKKENYKYFFRSFKIIQYSVLLLFFFINLMIISTGLGYHFPMKLLPNLIIGILFIVLGNYMQSVKSNYFLGIRTPWTLSDETVWKKTHRFGSKVFMVAGLLFIAGIFLPYKWGEIVIFPIILVTALLPIGYSYWVYKKAVKG
ncbi:SdpI family protein [Bacillus sp. 03113]|uniref:SdpI family protein n=1 Tax=Bacillus sp. 03113 TaxID=2578211 RepID=UPI001143CFB5|nr:SdpI family protein [Bacillus sp. 03113]